MPEQHRNLAAEYIDAVDRFVRPHVEPIMGPDGTYHGQRLAAPLLQVLANAGASGIGRGHGASGAPEARTPLNVGAIDLFDGIRKAVLSDYADMVDSARPDAAPAMLAVRLQVLNRYRAGTISGAALLSRIRRLQGWANAITALLDPPRVIELTAACPRCGERWATDPQGDQHAALTTTYHDARDAVSTCAHCHATWLGVDGARRLRIAIDEAERLRALLLVA